MSGSGLGEPAAEILLQRLEVASPEVQPAARTTGIEPACCPAAAGAVMRRLARHSAQIRCGHSSILPPINLPYVSLGWRRVRPRCAESASSVDGRAALASE